MVLIRTIIAALFIVFSALAAQTASAQDDDPALRQAIAGLGAEKGYSKLRKAIGIVVETGDPRGARVLDALSEGDVYRRETDGAVFIVSGRGKQLTLLDPVTGDETGTAAKSDLKKVRVNNSVRRSVREAIGALTLGAKDPGVRMSAARTMIDNPDPDSLDAIDTALDKETDADVRDALQQARAGAIILSDRDVSEKVSAIETIRDMGGQQALSLLVRARSGAGAEMREATDAAIASVRKRLQYWSLGQNVWYGLSLGSVLLLAAIGLAITFGVMGVINMAHGEMVMLGAYTTFMVQEIMRTSFPGLLDWSLPIALPLAFLVAGAVGFAMERGVIRFLYGRPLETLLATWGVSLILQQTVRTIFGPTNREVSNPSYMSGAFQLGELSITWNRLWIVVFALVVFGVLLYAMNRTSLGLKMRAVTQNRRMAAAMGIRTPWVDALTFALGSGIAGIAGVALSQIDNVSPNLGQGYIIDSFMVVVFGGVGNLWGTLIGALSLGVANKFLEPFAGAVLGKIFVLVFIILFIQKRPRGLFALKGRAVET
ncbi:urea ABC transporter permease subunit UrtB [Notoacmeibacter sp. MSK16QG-6]|uniref:urea ABC transporter permease subunit UrtB n=1 Tax=Notoacmeibacter sp. MSK16QG-6 TaxID=2957982 RepID=UPI00209E6F67|nr:urea ABC transporter permease subunit UrtB [Notoacmeibacter sp. MSK16QG-6]MCP1200416.1 urea ABC transporter permease subunit UrtB [Notoacmeibacter sp. MSK16QG-6]